MNLNSNFKDLGAVTLPPWGGDGVKVPYFWTGRNLHMFGFDPGDPILDEFFLDYTSLVIDLCHAGGVETERAWLTIDEREVQANTSQRRGGAHVDGRYVEAMLKWQQPSWNHEGGMSLITASSVAGCRAYEGVFEGEPKSDGDLEHIRDQLGEGVVLAPNRAFLLSPDCVHESMPLPQTVKRSFMRITF